MVGETQHLISTLFSTYLPERKLLDKHINRHVQKEFAWLTTLLLNYLLYADREKNWLDIEHDLSIDKQTEVHLIFEG